MPNTLVKDCFWIAQQLSFHIREPFQTTPQL
jgi:hypothetical protein